MDQRISGQHGDGAGDGYGGEGDDDAVGEVLQYIRHSIEHIAVMSEVKGLRPQPPGIRIWDGLDRHQQYPGNGQHHNQAEENDGRVKQNSGELDPLAARRAGSRIGWVNGFEWLGRFHISSEYHLI
jgi:hypothetical protein